MPSKKPSPAKSEEPKIDLISARAEGLSLLSPLEKKLSNFTVKSEEDYLQADEMLAQIHQGEKAWLSKVDPPIEHIRKGLDLLYDLKNSVCKPFATLKAGLKQKMKDYKLEEARLIREANEAKEKERLRLEAEAKSLAEKEANAKTKARQNELIHKRAEVEQTISEIAHAPVQAAVKGTGSNTRNVKKWRVTDLGLFMEHVLGSDEDLSSLIVVNQVEMNAYFSLKAPEVGKWMPGIEVYDDIDISSRGSR